MAQRLAEALRPVTGGDLPVRLRAWDGSEAGPADAPLVVLGSATAVRRMLWHPGELGAAQAYVTGELDVPGDLADALTHAFAVARERGLGARPTPAALVRAIRGAAGLGALGRPPPAPASQARLRGRLHSPLRDRRAVAHHYDLSNDFYRLLLDPSMAYSCGYWTSTDPAYTVADAQRDKLDLVCRKLGLEPGMRLLDVGCGWGSLSLHAAEHFGAQVTGVTIAAEQKRFVDGRIAERGLGDRVEIRLQDSAVVTDLLVVAGASLAVAVAAMTITALVARRLGRVNVVDVTWGLALVAVALVCAGLSPTWEAWLVLGLVAVWGVRLSSHILSRSRGRG